MSTPKNSSTAKVETYLFFNGRCEEAIEFYRRTLGAEEIVMSRFKDSPDPTMCPPGGGDKIMHASFRIGETMLMASDGRCTDKLDFQGFALSIASPSEAEADRLFAALSSGGQVQMPLTRTFFARRFGMVADRFGVSWMVIVRP